MHSGFLTQQALYAPFSSCECVLDSFTHLRTALPVLAAVQTVMSTYQTKTVTTVGHSLGAAISLLDAVYLKLHLPASTVVQFYGYGLPRVGNPAFASYVDGSGIKVTHINNEKDIGAGVPPCS
jgi:predicted lipase